jgi:hypothetical protein
VQRFRSGYLRAIARQDILDPLVKRVLSRALRLETLVRIVVYARPRLRADYANAPPVFLYAVLPDSFCTPLCFVKFLDCT